MADPEGRGSRAMSRRQAVQGMLWLALVVIPLNPACVAQQASPDSPQAVRPERFDPCLGSRRTDSNCRNPASVMKPPTRMPLMQSRYIQLRDAAAGLERTGVPLVAYNGEGFIGAGYSDDPGIFYFIPLLAHTAKISLETTIDLFFFCVAAVAFASGGVGSWRALRRPLSRAIALLALAALLALTLRLGDVYLVQSSIVAGLLPWFWQVQRARRSGKALFVFSMCAGFCAGVANFMRAQSGTAILVFLIFGIVLSGLRSRKEKVLAFLLLLAGLSAPTLYSVRLLANRDAYLARAQPGWKKVAWQHPFWHPVYVGFGFLQNEYVPMYRDDVAAARVRALAPSAAYLSKEYEDTLRREVFQLIRQHPGFVVLTLSAKLGVLLGILLVCANVGLLAVAWYPKGWTVELPYWVGLAFTALGGLLVVPQVPYLLGFVAFAVLYGVFSLEHAIERCRSGEIRGWFRWHLVQTLCAA
jgi:hypothetical protein